MDRIETRRAILAEMLPEIPFDGWSLRAAEQAAERLGLSAEDAGRVFPGGVREMIEFWSAVADEALLDRLKQEDVAALRIRDRIARAVRLRLEDAVPHKEAMRRALSILAIPELAIPGRGGRGARMLYRTVDTIWYGIGDRSADFSFYTKRMLLAGVYGATLLYWLEDRSDDHADSWAFLDRRIADVMQIPKLTGKLKQAGSALPDPLRLLTRMSRRKRKTGRRSL